MRDLKSFSFTNWSDNASSAEGWWVYASDQVTALDCNDVIQTASDGWIGDGPIEIEGSLDLGNGNDTLIGLCNENIGKFWDGIRIEEQGMLRTGSGYDKIIGLGGDYGIVNNGFIGTSVGNDLISTAEGYSRNGIVNRQQGTISTGTGDDIIRAMGSESVALVNEGIIDTGDGKDQIVGGDGQKVGAGIVNSAYILMGAHDDLISASGKIDGFNNVSPAFVNCASGHDAIHASGSRTGLGNQGTLYLGPGDDSIVTRSSQYAINNSGIIDTDYGNDTLRATSISPGSLSPVLNNQSGGVITLGDGVDLISVNSVNSSIGLQNKGRIDTGSGSSRIQVVGGKSFGIINESGGIINNGSSFDFIGIVEGGLFQNDGLITCGNGSDVVSSLNGGFSGDGTIDLGPGDDVLEGIAKVYSAKALYKGGSGFDRLGFKTGTYSVVDQGGGRYLIGGTMNVVGFEGFTDAASFLNLPAAAAQGYVVFR
jgi:hypothetical protein